MHAIEVRGTATRPGGVFIFDVAEPGRGSGPRLKHFQGTDWAIQVEVDEDKERRRLTRRITTFRKVGRLYRRAQEVHELQLYDRSAVAAELCRNGFRVRTLGGHGRHGFPKALVGFHAGKPSKPRGRDR